MTHSDEDKPTEALATTDDLPPVVESDDENEERGPVPLKDIRPEDIAKGIQTFEDLPLHPAILEFTKKIGWLSPTPVQKLCLPYSLRGRDVAGFAQTGTGKTAVFLITILNRLLAAQVATDSPIVATDGAPAEAAATAEAVRPAGPRAVILAPTRELAMQSEQDAQEMFAATGITSMAVFGGIDYDKQARQLKDGVDVIFATPGRLMDYIKKKLVTLDHVAVFVCDEADRMFDMGFIDDVEFFLARIPKTAQRLLFSATTNEQVKELAFEYLETPEYVSVNPETLTPEKIEQHAIHCHATEKLRVLLGLLRDHNPECSIIFTNTKLTAEWLHFKLVNNGIEADLITGDLPQSKRIRLIKRIKDGELKALIATDVASRGLHISRVTHVYNFDLPDDAANYVHRVGRTARAGARGFAFSLVCDDYGQNLSGINDLLGPAIAMHTGWPEERYLSIEDKAGDPFVGRWRHDRPSPSRAGAEFGRGPSGDRGPRRDGPSSDRGPRRDGPGSDRGPDRGPRRDGPGSDRGPDRGPRGDHAANGNQNQGGPRRPVGDRPQGDRPGFQGQGQDQGGDKKRRRGRGGQGGRDGQPGQPGQQQGQGGRPGQQQGQGRQQQGNDPRRQGQGQQGQGNQQRGRQDAPLAAKAPDTQAPRSMGGMLKKIVKTLFGWGK